MADPSPTDPASVPGGACFRTTHWSLVAQAGGQESEEAHRALESLCRSYWYPLFAYVRYRGYPAHQAEDLTQAFFVQLLSKNYLAGADRTRGRFRTFLLTSMNHFLANQWDRDQALKRGGGCEFVSLSAAADPGELPHDPGHQLTPERLFEKRWAEAVLGQVLERLRSEFDGANVKRFEVLKPFLVEVKGAISYLEAAQVLGMTESAIKSAVHRMRQRWRELMREEIAQTLNAATASEVDEEIHHLIRALQ